MKNFIYCQNDIPKHQLRYGLRSSAATGCGWIAVYNILVLFGHTPDPKQIIYEFEHDVPLLNGNFGTFLMSVAWVLRRHGYLVQFTTKRTQIDAFAQNSDAGILFYWWKSKKSIGAHFVAIQKTEEGYFGYNTYSNSKGPDFLGPSIEAFLDQKNYFGAVFFKINATQE